MVSRYRLLDAIFRIWSYIHCTIALLFKTLADFAIAF